MMRISRNAMEQAITVVRAMDVKQKEQLAYVQVETMKWLTRIVPEESDKYIVLAAWNIANCIAFVPILAPNAKSIAISTHSQ
jgi:hypothetical protein